MIVYFFCKANSAEFGVILKLFKEYKAVSGQPINFGKPSSQIGHKVLETMRLENKSHLGITNLGGMGNFLGIPESVGGYKVQFFGFLNEGLIRRLVVG